MTPSARIRPETVEGDRSAAIPTSECCASHGSSAAWEWPEITSYADEDHLQRILADAPDRVPGVSTAAVSVRNCRPRPARSTSASATRTPRSPWWNADWPPTRSTRHWSWAGPRLRPAITADCEAAFRAQWSRRGDPTCSTCSARPVSTGSPTPSPSPDKPVPGRRPVDADLRRLVEYLNRITRAEIRVTALQLAYARHGDLELLIAATFGGEIAAAEADASGRNQRWTIAACWRPSEPTPTATAHNTSSTGSRPCPCAAPTTLSNSAPRPVAASTCTPTAWRTRRCSCGSAR